MGACNKAIRCYGLLTVFFKAAIHEVVYLSWFGFYLAAS